MKIVFPPAADAARAIARKILKTSGEAYIIGGSVRDLCLGIEPKDYDVATSLTPDELLDIFPHANLTGKAFGVLRVKLRGEEIEIATYRRDGPYSDGRRPDHVEFTNLEEDILRRDFTVNAMAADIETGEVIDFTGGICDLEERVIRAVGDPRKRFEEDKLRLIRAIRFAHRLGFRIETATWEALSAMSGSIRDVAMERVADEFTKTITRTPSGNAIRLLDDSGLLRVILPELLHLKGVQQPEQFHPEGDCWVHTLLTMDELMPDPPPAVAWAALLHDIGKPRTFMVTDRIRFHGHAELGARMAQSIGRRFRLSNEMIDRIHVIILEHQKFGNIAKMRPGRLRNWAGQPHFADLLEVHRADCVASHKDMSAFEKAREAMTENERLIKMPEKHVTGGVLITMGYTPGPLFKRIIERAYEAQLEGVISDRATGEAWVKRAEGEGLFLRQEVEEDSDE